ncbi:unnamed protein product [Timema podura]|uniref:Uncharacterized protein n=1 Tax=Timema podura TaxID=61482 RepID=A0ABN7P6U4_TIMPD|nr:unnamed protein product [Timema podura]
MLLPLPILSKEALLCRIAATRTGAELLLEQGALACLSSMQVLDRHPDIKTLSTAASMDFYPSISSRYMQILFPALNFCDAILTSLGTKNQSCTAQVLHFLMSHNDTVNLVLHSGSPYIQLIFLKELARLTCIISRASQQAAGKYVCLDLWIGGSVMSVEGKAVHIQHISSSYKQSNTGNVAYCDQLGTQLS